MTGERPDDARSTCANCASLLTGPFCPQCGQKDLGTRVTLWELTREVISESFEIEGRLPRTLVSIALRPGEYLGEYLDGKRRSYASPFRFYLVMVFLAAVVMGWRGQTYADAIGGVNIENTANGTMVNFVPKREVVDRPMDYSAFPSTVRPRDHRCDGILPCYPTNPVDEHAQVDWLASLEPLELQQSYDQPVEHVFRRLALGGPAVIYRVMYNGWIQQLPVLMAVMLLGLAAGLKVLWPRSPATVAVVTSMVLHSLALVGLVIWLLVSRWWVLAAVLVWLFVQTLFGLKRAYGSPWPRTVASTLAVGGVWSVVAVLGLGVGAYRLVMDLLDSGIG